MQEIFMNMKIPQLKRTTSGYTCTENSSRNRAGGFGQLNVENKFVPTFADPSAGEHCHCCLLDLYLRSQRRRMPFPHQKSSSILVHFGSSWTEFTESDGLQNVHRSTDSGRKTNHSREGNWCHSVLSRNKPLVLYS